MTTRKNNHRAGSVVGEPGVLTKTLSVRRTPRMFAPAATYIGSPGGGTLAIACGIALATMYPNAIQAQSDKEVEEVVITGSRIARRDFTSQSPIVTITAETFENRMNVGLETGLNQMPQFTAAGTQASLSPASTPFPQATAAPGAATINLRGLGTNRSLVLVDGRRVQPVNGLLVVDLNTIPSAAIENVEVITGGAAAVYGADAIAGVVNLKLRNNFEGLELNGQFGVTQEGDGEELQFSGLFGANYADNRGNVMIGGNYADRNIIYGKDRKFTRSGWDDPATQSGGIGSSNLSRFVISGSNRPTAGFALRNNASEYAIDQNGNIFDPQDPLNAAHKYTGPLGGTSGFKVNPDGTLGYDDREHTYIQIPMSRYAVFGNTTFSVTDQVDVFLQARFSESKVVSRGFTSGLFNIWSPTVPYNALYDDPDSPTFGQAPTGVAEHPVPRGLADLLNSRPTATASWTYAGGLDYLGNFTTSTTSNVYQMIGGLRGRLSQGFAEDWTWEIYASHGKSNVIAFQPEGFPNLARIQNLFNATQYGEGYSVSFPIAITGSCTSGLPIFNADGTVDNTPTVSKNCSDYTVMRFNSVTTLAQDVIEANLQGRLWQLPAGDLQFAIGGDFRQEKFRFDPDSGYNANQDFPNVVQNIILPVSVDGTTRVKEVYAELAIPIVEDLPLIKRFELDPGVRYSDYNTTGGIETYKVLGDWAVVDWFRFRGGYQRANRAPNVTELFTPKGGSQLEVGADACAFFASSPATTPTWGNHPDNPNRFNVQALCQYLITRDGGPASIMVPGASANSYAYTVFGPATTPFPFTIAVVEGNRNLDSESAKTWTGGFVLNSPWQHPLLERLTLSVDFFTITVKDAIGTPTHNSVYQQCLDATYNSLVGSAAGSQTGAALAANNPYCALIQREYIGNGSGDWGAPRKFKAQYINQGGIKSRGIDVQFDWRADLADLGLLSALPGAVSVNVLASYLDKYAVSPFPGGAYVDSTGTTTGALFDYRVLSTFGYSNGPWSAGLRWQHLPSVTAPPGSAADVQGASSHDQLDLFGRWAVTERYEVRAGIDNLLNTQPEVVGATSTDANLGTTNTNYDQFGRRFFLAFKATF